MARQNAPNSSNDDDRSSDYDFHPDDPAVEIEWGFKDTMEWDLNDTTDDEEVDEVAPAPKQPHVPKRLPWKRPTTVNPERTQPHKRKLDAVDSSPESQRSRGPSHVSPSHKRSRNANNKSPSVTKKQKKKTSSNNRGRTTKDPAESADSNASDDSDADDSDYSDASSEPKTRKRAHSLTPEQLTSGDEAVIGVQSPKKKRARKRKGKGVAGQREDDEEEEEADEGHWVKTRSQRRAEEPERAALATTEGATIDVNAKFAELDGVPIGPERPEPPAVVAAAAASRVDDYVIITREIKFAGTITIEEKRVRRDSEEAKLYLAEQEANRDKEVADADAAAAASTFRRPLKRQSRFEPNPLGLVKGLPPNEQRRYPPRVAAGGDSTTTEQQPEQPEQPRAEGLMLPPPRPSRLLLAGPEKPNTVEKSRHDWVNFKAKAGLQEELEGHGKSKQSYMDRTDFLNRTENRLEDERREAATKRQKLLKA
jgi:hypothetical protein